MRDLAPGQPFTAEIKLPRGVAETDLRLRVTDRAGKEIISYQPRPRAQSEVPPPATEPPAPADIASADELFITGLHLEQYRHATRCPTLYWREALRRDPLDARCNNALGLWHLQRGEFAAAEPCFRQAIARLTRRNANPYDGEAYYNLGLTLRFLGRDDEAYDAFYKACWNQAWMAAGYHALAEMDCCRKDWLRALEHLNRSLRLNLDNGRAANLSALVLRQLGQGEAADLRLKRNRETDPLDWWTRHLLGEPLACDLQTALDLAHDYARAGFYSEAVRLLSSRAGRDTRPMWAHRDSHDVALPTQSLGAGPLAQYTLGWLLEKAGDIRAARARYREAGEMPPDYCFPARLEEIAILEAAMRANPRDARAPYYLGNLLYDRRRHAEAIRLWEKSARLDPSYSVVWRNLGIGYFNIRRKARAARAAYERAFRANPADARLLYERDQLWKRLGEKPARRLRELGRHLPLVKQRDDLSVELCALYNQTGQPEKALALVSSRKFQPWEGGEGGPLGQWVRAHLALGKAALGQAEQEMHNGENRQSLLASAVAHFEAALTAPENLGEAKHLLANQSDIHYWLGCALDVVGETKRAREHWRAAATFKGDFQEMSVRAFSEMTYYSARAWEKLGQRARAKKLFRELLAYAQQLQQADAKIDYFATSLPTMLLFDDDLRRRQETTALFLQAQARLGLDQKARARQWLGVVLRRDPNHAPAADLWRELRPQTGTGTCSLTKSRSPW